MTEESHATPEAAVAALRRLYEQESGRLRDCFDRFVKGEAAGPARG